MTKELTGRHVLIIALVAFATIIAANMTMLFAATGSFPGLVVRNSYVASQGWDARTEAQAALHRQTLLTYTNGTLTVAISDDAGAPVTGLELTGIIGRPSSDREDRPLILTEGPDGYLAQVDLAPGPWRIDLGEPETGAYNVTASLLIPEPK